MRIYRCTSVLRCNSYRFSPFKSSLSAAETVLQGRAATENILRGNDDRLCVVVGCVRAAACVFDRALIGTQSLLSAQCPICS
jgi:phospho-2-dehydro-3-deoxyheptonate aldolase